MDKPIIEVKENENMMEKEEDYTHSGEIEVYMGANCDSDKVIDPLIDLMTAVWEAGGGFLGDCLRVKIVVEYVPENK
jgi:hypothetical protein